MEAGAKAMAEEAIMANTAAVKEFILLVILVVGVVVVVPAVVALCRGSCRDVDRTQTHTRSLSSCSRDTFRPDRDVLPTFWVTFEEVAYLS